MNKIDRWIFIMADCARRNRKFVVDAMLGKLARWLRILGYDTIYDPGTSDRDLIITAVNENRMLVTRDRRLAQAKRPGLETVFIKADKYRDQLREIVSQLGRPESGMLTRCLECNTVLDKLSPEDAAGNVPEYILHTHRKFRQCPTCRRIYWPGTHLDDIRRVLKETGISLG